MSGVLGYVPRRSRRPSRLRRRGPSSLAQYLAAAVIVLAATGVMIVLHVNVGLMLGVLGVLIAILVFLLQEGRFWRPQKRTVVFVGKSNSSFSVNILAGVEESLKSIPVDIVKVLPSEKHESNNLAFQVDSIKKPPIQSAHAVVIVPVGDKAELCNELRQLAGRGIFLVVIDFKVPNQFFYEGDLPLPRFVSSDFRRGGELVAELIADQLRQKKADLAIVLLGPKNSTPGFIRSSVCLYELGKAGLSQQVVTEELENWDGENAVEKFAKLVTHINRSSPGESHKICVFCGNDVNVGFIDRYLSSDPDAEGGHSFTLVGYDGVRGLDKTLFVQTIGRCIGTVDALPQLQGSGAGVFLIAEYEGRTSSAKNALIGPNLLRRPTWN